MGLKVRRIKPDLGQPVLSSGQNKLKKTQTLALKLKYKGIS